MNEHIDMDEPDDDVLYCATIAGSLLCILAPSAERAAELVGLDGVVFEPATDEEERAWDSRSEDELNERDVAMLLSFVRRAQRDQAGQFRRYRERGKTIPPAAIARVGYLAVLRGKLEVMGSGDDESSFI